MGYKKEWIDKLELPEDLAVLDKDGNAFLFEKGDFVVSKKFLEDLQGIDIEVADLEKYKSFAEQVGYNICKECGAFTFPGYTCHGCGNNEDFTDEWGEEV